ncbi:hypothetical protein ACJQWK_08714 [Exserohilum turcicum]
MSEPSKTGGLPLDPTTTNPPQLQGTTTTPPPTSLHIQHYNTLSTNNRPKVPKKTSPRRRLVTNHHDEPSLPHISSSRSEQQSTASPTDMASHMPPVHYTKTGRVSKAKKGLKVHKCDVCGKSYTRAEHLRRHKRNHAPDDALVCEVSGCGKMFHRMDLLVRHQERHNEMGHDSGRQSPAQSPVPMTVSTPALEPSMLSAATALPAHPYYQPVSPALESAPLPSQSKHRGLQFSRQLGPASVPVDVPSLWPEPYSPNPGYSSSSGYVSPIAPTDYPVFSNTPYHRTRTPSNASCIDQPGWSFPSRSPASTTSTMAFTWPSTEKGHTAPGLAYMHTTCPMTSMSMTSSFDGMPDFGHFGAKSMAQRDEEEAAIIFGDQQYGMPSIDNTYPFEQCLDSYSRLFHPAFPVVHRSAPVSSSPMLYAAMAAIGGQFSHDTNIKKQSRDLHDRCVKLLERRDYEAMTEADRLCDFQAMFLVEVMSQYRARRAGKVLSSRFEKVYHRAADDCRSTTLLLGDILSSLNQLGDVTPELWHQWIELASWQRLLLSCYILESQQAILLARKPLPSLFQGTAFDLPFPAHVSLWDATDFPSWVAAARQHSYTPTYVYEITPDSTSVSLDSFQSAVLLASQYQCPKNSSYISLPTASDMEHLFSTTPATARTLSTSKLVQVTPLRALLAVAGESWILSEKVETAQLFTTLKRTLRTWVSQLWSPPAPDAVPVKEAVRLSIEILQQALQEQRLSVLPEIGTDMGIFFAALVLWAATVAATTRLSGPRPTEAQQQCQSDALPSSSSTNKAPQAAPCDQAPDRPSTRTTAGCVYQSNAGGPPSPIIEATPENPILSHAQITINTISFLNSAQLTYSNAATTTLSTADHLRHQTGCISLLLWVKLRLRGVSLEDQHVASDTWPSQPGESLGELLDGVVGSLERILSRGWSGWGI